MSARILRSLSIASTLIMACGADYAPYTPDEAETDTYGTAEAAVAACLGDDLQYDFNAFAASLAVASANELGRWDALADFEVLNSKLELSQTGLLHCGTSACKNITALLRLQDDAASVVPYHSPSVYRTKLTGWYAKQKNKLIEAAAAAKHPEDTYRLVSKLSGKRLMVDGGSTADNAIAEVWDTTSSTGADQWNLRVSGAKYKLINVRSGKCLDLAATTATLGAGYVQKTCSTSDSQLFAFQDLDLGYVGLINKFGQAAELKGWSTANDVPIVSANWSAYEDNKIWTLQSVTGTTSTGVVANGMHVFQLRHSAKMLAVDASSVSDGALVTQRAYNAVDDTFNWYVSKVGDKYQLINRRSGMCLALLTNSSTAVDVGQRACANVDTQKFTFERINNNGEAYYGIRGPYSKIVVVQSFSMTEGARLVLQAGNPIDNWNGQFKVTDLLAGEPHRLTFNHASNDGPCGAYFWYDIKQPNGLALSSPAQSFVQLMFAGGKETLTGADENPFIAQQVSGTQVAIDPSGYMTGGASTSSASCIAADILYDSTQLATGTCCIKYTGVTGKFVKSAWSPTTFVCQ